MLSSTSHNPDVLSCLANLSNDEVFTPPQLVNQILDMLPKDLWSDKKATFLDPVCKSGVFLREIAKRLDDGSIIFSRIRSLVLQSQNLHHCYRVDQCIVPRLQMVNTRFVIHLILPLETFALSA